MCYFSPCFRYLVFIFACYATVALGADQTGTYVGAKVCGSCHAKQYKRWKGSHHDWAMQPATRETVLGDFNNARYEHNGQISLFSQKEGRFYVTTENTQGQQEKFEIRYTFGVYPLQQYLIGFEDGRYQAFSVAWDARPVTEGGQRWFHLYPDETSAHDDQLHWTGPYLNWNSRCAECHSTNLRKNYDAETDSYDTRWSEINVACEACHGPGKKHLQWATEGSKDTIANAGFQWDLRAVGSWLRRPGEATAKHQVKEEKQSSGLGRQIDACGGCHARRSIIGREHQGHPFTETYQLSLPQTPLYHADGQILDEDYVVGSFLQSKMFHNGVECSNCHDPHSLKLRASDNGVCAQCHNPSVFDGPQHHHHPKGSSGTVCANCHMPETTYMVVDPRRDHSIRIPRPDLSLQHGTPNACTRCHRQQTDKWAADTMDQWLAQGKKSLRPHFSERLAAGQGSNPDAVQLMQLATNPGEPGIARAAAVAQLQQHPGPEALLTVQTNLNATDPMVRRAAVDAMGMASPEQRQADLSPLMTDNSKLVRLGVAAQLASLDPRQLPEKQRRQLLALFDEYREAQLINADMPAAQVNLGLFYSARGLWDQAEEAYRKALKLDPKHIPARLNLADLYRQLERESEGEALLRKATQLAPEQATVHHALGLLLVRQKQYEKALPSLQRAAELAPEDIRYGYVYAVALNSQGKSSAAIAVLKKIDQRYPNRPEILQTLIDILARQSQWKAALMYAERLQEQQPENDSLRRWIDYLRSKQ